MNCQLSIIIPVYQAEKYIEDTVASVCKQELQDWELILVNDGSTDCSGDICDALAQNDDRITVIHQSNLGQSAARNRGMERARGEYLFFMDNDDLLEPKALTVLLNDIRQNKADVAAGSYRVLDDMPVEAKPDEKLVFCNSALATEKLLTREMDIYIWTKIYRREFLNDNGIVFEEGRSDEDFLFNTQVMICAQKITWRNSVVVCRYRVRSDSACRTLPTTKLYKYIADTLYRLEKTENMIMCSFPNLISLARKQTVFYLYILIGRISESGNSDYHQTQYGKIIKYLRYHWQVTLECRKYCGKSLGGIWMTLLLPARWQFVLRRSQLLHNFRR